MSKDGRDVEARPKEYLRKKGKNVSIEADDCVDVRGRMRGWLPECVCVCVCLKKILEDVTSCYQI